MKTIDNALLVLIGLAFGLVIGVVIGLGLPRDTSPVEETDNGALHTIDSLIQVNDSIKIKVEKLDSIKNAKVVEVSTLDNDSTLKLFYELVKE